jgi:hypothetical protein
MILESIAKSLSGCKKQIAALRSARFLAVPNMYYLRRCALCALHFVSLAQKLIY